MKYLIFIMGLIAAPAIAEEAAMSESQDHAVRMESTLSGDAAEISLIGRSDQALTVEYELEVEGRSRTRHRGKTSLAAGQRAVLSKVRIDTDGDWCARLTVSQSDGASYEETAGPCSSRS